MTTLISPRRIRRRRRYADRSGMAKPHLRALARAMFGARRYSEDGTARRIRIFTADDWCRPEDVREWLLHCRVVELADALEYISRDVLRFLIREGYLWPTATGHFYWVTAKAADKYNLPPVLGCRFPKAPDMERA